MASSLEGNKIAGAILTAGIIAMGTGVLSGILYHPHELEEPVFKVALPEGGGGGAPSEEPAQPLPVLLAAATPEQGEGVAKKCSACHTFDAGGAAKVGPNLHDIVGRDIASAAGFSYSPALTEKEGNWTYDDLDHFLMSPKEWAPGTKMSFAGLSNPKDRAEIIVYLRSITENPPPLPEAPAAVAEEAPADEVAPQPAAETENLGEQAPPANVQQEGAQQAAGAETQTAAAPADSGVAASIAGGNPEQGANVAKKCLACHSFDKGGANKVGPNLYGVVGRPVASHEGFNYSGAMKEHGGDWTYDALYHYLENPKAYVPGNKMAFAGIKKPEDLANLIAYLREQADEPVPLPEKGS